MWGWVVIQKHDTRSLQPLVFVLYGSFSFLKSNNSFQNWWSLHIPWTLQAIFFSHPQKTVAITFLADKFGKVSLILFGEAVWPHTTDYCFASAFIYNAQISLHNNFDENYFPPAMQQERKSKAEPICCVPWFSESTLGAHWGQNLW